MPYSAKEIEWTSINEMIICTRMNLLSLNQQTGQLRVILTWATLVSSSFFSTLYPNQSVSWRMAIQDSKSLLLSHESKYNYH